MRRIFDWLFLYALRNQKKEILEEFEFFKYPSIERSKEWFEGYNYCKEGVKETIEELKDNK